MFAFEKHSTPGAGYTSAVSLKCSFCVQHWIDIFVRLDLRGSAPLLHITTLTTACRLSKFRMRLYSSVMVTYCLHHCVIVRWRCWRHIAVRWRHVTWHSSSTGWCPGWTFYVLLSAGACANKMCTLVRHILIHRESKNKTLNSCPQLLQMLTDFQDFFTDRLSGKFATNLSLNIPPRLKYVATLPYEI